MYFGASAFLIAIGIILIVAPRDATRTLPLDLVGVAAIAVGALGLLVNVARRVATHRAHHRLARNGTAVSAVSTPRQQRRARSRRSR